MTLRIGVIGTGTAARVGHLPAIDRSSGCILAAAADVVPQQLDGIRPFGPAWTTTDPAALLAASDVDAVIVATPPETHFELALEAIRAGKHLLVEKPLARSLAECNELVAAAAAAGVCLAVGHEKRFNPTLQRVRTLLTDDTIGRAFYAGVHWGSNAKLAPEHLIPPGYDRGYRWRWENPDVGGGLLQDHLPHYLDLVRHWLGCEPTGVYAVARNVARELLDWELSASVWDDFSLVVVRFDDGFVLRFETSVVGRTLSPLLGMGSGVGEWTEYAYILGTRGQLLVDLYPWDSSEHGRIAVWQLDRATSAGEGWTFVEQPEPPRTVGVPAGAAGRTFESQLEAWLAAIAGRSTSIALGSDGAACLAVVDAAYASSGHGAEVSIAQHPAEVVG